MVVGDLARWLRDEEAAGSNPATPTQVKAGSDLGAGYSSSRTAVRYESSCSPSLDQACSWRAWKVDRQNGCPAGSA